MPEFNIFSQVQIGDGFLNYIIMAGSLVRVSPLYYMHILNNNTNVIRLEVGPHNITIEAHEAVVLQPTQMIVIPPLHYCKFENPVVMDSDNQPVMQQFEDEDGVRQIYKVNFGAKEIRTHQTHPEPFPLYPYEKIVGKVEKIVQIPVNSAIKLKANADFQDQNGKQIKVGDEWIIEGPCSYIPHTKVDIVENINAEIVTLGTALKIQALRDCIDIEGKERKTGEKYLIRQQGAYIRKVEEKILKIRKSVIITQKKCLYLRAKTNFVDVYGVSRKAGEEWLVTKDMADWHIQDVNEKVIDQPEAITLTRRQYCYILDPFDQKTNKNLYGLKQLKKGECTFFLQPKEQIENDDIFDIFILADDEALLLQAEKEYDDGKDKHVPGNKWMIYGPCEYIPPVEVKVLETRRKIQLAEMEGIYIRDIKTGEVRSQIGVSYMLKPYEEVWEKPLSWEVEWLLGFRVKAQTLLNEIANIAGGDQSQVEDLKNQIAMLNLELPKEDPSFKQAQDLSSNFLPSKMQQRAQKRAVNVSNQIEQKKRKAPIRRRAAQSKEKAKELYDFEDENQAEEEELAVDFKREADLMNRLQIFNVAQQEMQCQNQQSGFQALQMGNFDDVDVDKIQEEKEEDYQEQETIPVIQQQPQKQSLAIEEVLKPSATSAASKGRGGARKAGARYLEESFMQQIQDELPFGTMEQAPVQKVEKEYFDFQQKLSSAPQPQYQQQQVQQVVQAPQQKVAERKEEAKVASKAKAKAKPEKSEYKSTSRFPAPEESQPIKFRQAARPWDDTISLRDRKKQVTFRAPLNSAIQIYNFKTKCTRVEFGPQLIQLEPDELFTICRLSGGRPKKENAIALLYLPLGPDFMADVVEIETSDHARLQLSLTYHWKFDIKNKEDAQKIFAIRDFIGYGCSAMASRIRGLCSKYHFDDFHKNSAELIKQAAFGNSTELRFESNNLVIFGIDIQYVEPVDKKTRSGLLQSVSMAIEISTQMTKADAEHIAAKQEQQWLGLLARQKIQDQVKAEQSRKRLLELQAESKAVESTGHAIAIAKAQAETLRIDGEASVEKATLHAKSSKIIQETDIELSRLVKEQELEHKQKLFALEIDKAKKLAEIEISKFQQQIKAIGAQTLISMAKAGPEHQAKLLKGLGLKGFMMMDGKRPVNLFNTAMGMVNQAQMS